MLFAKMRRFRFSIGVGNTVDAAILGEFDLKCGGYYVLWQFSFELLHFPVGWRFNRVTYSWSGEDASGIPISPNL